MGLLNRILATVALTAGGVAPSRPAAQSGGIAVASGTPVPFPGTEAGSSRPGATDSVPPGEPPAPPVVGTPNPAPPPGPAAVAGPPGHATTNPPASRPCNVKGGKSGNHGHGIVLAPFALGGALLTVATRIRRRTARLVRVRRRR